jgi:hypothetical protein
MWTNHSQPTDTATALATTTTPYTSTTATTVTATATTQATAYKYSLKWNKDNCGYAIPHIVDYAMAGYNEQQAIDNCMDTCSSKSLLPLFLAFTLTSYSTSRSHHFRNRQDSNTAVIFYHDWDSADIPGF